MGEVEECLNLYLSNFPDGFLPSSDISEPQEKQKFDEINQFAEQSFILLSKSVLCGEYISNPSFQVVLKTFIDKTAIEYAPLLSPKNKISNQYIQLNSSLYNALRHYQSIIDYAKRKFDTTDTDNQYRYFRIKNSTSDSILNLFIDITVPLCKYDYRFPADSTGFDDLLIIRDRLKRLIGESNSNVRIIYSLLLQKCNFIIQRIRTNPFYCYLDSDFELINPVALELGDYNQLVIDDSLLDDEKKELLNDINSEQPKLKSFVRLMRHYKNVLTKSDEISSMDKVLKRFLAFYKSETYLQRYTNPQNLKEQYDKFSLNSILNFVYNCRFSFYTKKCNPSLKDIKNEIRKIEEIQSKTGVKNFHPYEKAIEAVTLCIESHLKTNEFEDNLIKEKLDELDRLIASFENAYEWSESHKFFPFQLPFDESLCPSESAAISLFVPSAHAKYIDYDFFKDSLVKFKQKSEYLKYSWGLSKERKEVNQLKENIKNTDKKAVDLIALFTAAITFLFGVVNVFIVNDKMELSQLIAKTVVLGIFLALFMCLYLLISPLLIQRMDWKKFIKTGRFIWGIFGVIIYTGGVILLLKSLNADLVSINNSSTKSDSVTSIIQTPKVVYDNLVRDSIIIEEVVPVPKMASSQLYGKVKLFFTKSSDLFKGTIQSEDPDNHIIVGKGRIKKVSDKGAGIIYYNFTISVQTKDEKYRYTITDLYVDMTGLVPAKEKNVYLDSVAQIKNSIVVPINDYYIEMAPVITLLKEQMQSKESDNW